jgi:hypothetical protein
MKISLEQRLKDAEEAIIGLQEQLINLTRAVNRTRSRPQFITEPDPFPLAVEPGACKPGAE